MDEETGISECTLNNSISGSDFVGSRGRTPFLKLGQTAVGVGGQKV